LAEYRERFAELTALGLGLFAVSVDEPVRSRALKEQLGLPFELLSDESRAVVQAYGLFNREENGGIAYPALFMLDRDRTVRFRSLDRTATRVDPGAVFAFLESGLGSAAPDAPARRRVVPGLRDVGRVIANMLRYGVRSPKP
jgi:peroxiredoxin